jgi:hypothetical protein
MQRARVNEESNDEFKIRRRIHWYTPIDAGGSGWPHGPMPDYYAHEVPRIAQYVYNETMNEEAIDLSSQERGLLKRLHMGGADVPLERLSPEYVDPRLIKVRVRYLATDEQGVAYGRKF